MLKKLSGSFKINPIWTEQIRKRNKSSVKRSFWQEAEGKRLLSLLSWDLVQVKVLRICFYGNLFSPVFWTKVSSGASVTFPKQELHLMYYEIASQTLLLILFSHHIGSKRASIQMVSHQSNSKMSATFPNPDSQQKQQSCHWWKKESGSLTELLIQPETLTWERTHKHKSGAAPAVHSYEVFVKI